VLKIWLDSLFRAWGGNFSANVPYIYKGSNSTQSNAIQRNPTQSNARFCDGI
jgi:hypothetical protein